MPLTQQQQTSFRRSLLTLGAGTDLAARVIKNIVGNDIGNSLNGEIVSLNDLRTLVQSRLRQKMNNMITDYYGVY